MQPAALLRAAPWKFSWPANPTLFLCIVGIVLPNMLSLGAMLAGIGSPPRTGAIFAYATLAVIARVVSPVATVLLYLAVVAYDSISPLALLFNLAPTEIGIALHLSAELKLFDSPLYIALILALAATVVLNIHVLTSKRDILRRGNVLVMMGCACAFAAADLLTNTSAHYRFGTLYAAGKPMESALDASGFHAAVTSGSNRHTLMVMVEALGKFDDPQHQAILMQPFRDPELLRRYSVTSGATTYYGSTTAAEMRELCNTRAPYQNIIAGKEFNCLPEQMKQRGYHTIGLHNFTGAFFDRYLWYPKLGFERVLFAPDIAPNVSRLCGGPFKGPCDVDVVPLIGKELREAKKPTFYYWMTLSTHVPIAPHEGTPRLNCGQKGGALGHTEVCYMAEIWVDVFEAIARLAADLPETEILIIGDHAPPLWSKAGRALFTPGQVTWVRLAPRAGGTSVSGLN